SCRCCRRSTTSWSAPRQAPSARRSNRTRSAFLPAPAQEAGRDVPPREAGFDPPEMPGGEIPCRGAELISQEGAARADHAVGRRRDRGADALGKRRKRQARKNVIGLRVAEGGDDRLDILGRAEHRVEAAVADRALEIV